jgi:hypothetical protein
MKHIFPASGVSEPLGPRGNTKILKATVQYVVKMRFQEAAELPVRPKRTTENQALDTCHVNNRK